MKNLKQDYPIDFQKIVNASNDIRDLEDGIKTLNSLKNEFGFDK